ncbi:hypothetical protein AB6A40_000080 [Gnathostoma spinigerum]|uniref:ZP domain-containing protein n=1 Tax=Gnathostoma spinigerum TaxID=75299 RepID=A0ABD6E2M0_9BILA
MRLYVTLENPLNTVARVFVKDQSANPDCSQLYEPKDDYDALMFRIQLNSCGMQRVRQQTNLISFSVTVIISFHPLFVSKFDRAYRLTCDYIKRPEKPTRNFTAGLGIRGIDENLVDTQIADDTECIYTLSIGGKSIDSSESVHFVRIGDPIEHHWKCPNLLPTEFFVIHDCFVNPEFSRGNDPMIVDHFGCPSDPLAMEQIDYSGDGHSAVGKHSAYKFADYPNILFRCSLTICRRDMPSCTDRYGNPLEKAPNCRNERQKRSEINDRNPKFASWRKVQVLSAMIHVGDLQQNVVGEREITTDSCPTLSVWLLAIAVICLFAFILLFWTVHRWNSTVSHSANQTISKFGNIVM